MPYVYEEGWVPVPARACPRCGAALGPAAGTGDGKITGWFEPSRLDEGTWLFTSKEEAEAAEAEELVCTACQRRYRLHPRGEAATHPQPEA